jgi:hypothetical protein
LTAPRLAVNVRGRGRHYKNPKTGKLVPSVTNVISVLDKPALSRWASLETAKAAAALKASLPSMDDEEIVSTLKGAPWRKADRAADRGTTIHEWLEKAMLGEPVPDLDGEALDYEQAAHGWLDAFKPEPVVLECTMFAPAYAGTADGIVNIQGEAWLIDFKTSKGLYESAALQLAALYACKIVANEEEGWSDAPQIDRVAAVRIGTEGQFEMKEVVDLDAHAKAFRACLRVWEWQKDTQPFGDTIGGNNE